MGGYTCSGMLILHVLQLILTTIHWQPEIWARSNGYSLQTAIIL